MDFESFYINWYSRVKHFAFEYVKSEAEAENITQDLFLDLYERNIYQDKNIHLVAYLFTSVKNRCLDYLRHRIIEKNAALHMQNELELTLCLNYESLSEFDFDVFSQEDLEIVIKKALETLPKRCQEIFILNKFEGKKQKEIAKELKITVNTVESQMSIAYKKLRLALKDYVPLLLFLF